MSIRDALAVEIADQSARDVWLVLNMLAKDGETCAPSVADIALHTGISERSTQYAITELRRLKLVSVERKAGRGNVTVYHLKGAKFCLKGCNALSNENNDITKNAPLIESKLSDGCTLSSTQKGAQEMTARLKVIHRRKRVRDGYLTFLSILGEGQYITAPALAKELGIPTTTVRNDLMALFRSLDIPLEAQFRFRKSQRRPWHTGKMGGKVIPFYDRGAR